LAYCIVIVGKGTSMQRS